MSVRTAIYERLANDPALNNLLARSNIEGMEEAPAIYERWAAEGTPFPFINLIWTFGESSAHWVKREGVLTVDIFTGGADSTQNEAIQRRIVELLDHEQTIDPEDGRIETYYQGELDTPEDTPNVIHWSLDFRVDHWRESFINYIQ